LNIEFDGSDAKRQRGAVLIGQILAHYRITAALGADGLAEAKLESRS
jgi:hypothetical protein